jgi:hypothetical protein
MVLENNSKLRLLNGMMQPINRYILSVLEKRALRYNIHGRGVNDGLDKTKFDNIDETGTGTLPV